MHVKLLKMGHPTREFTEVNAGATIGRLLSDAQLSSGGYSVSLNGLAASLEAEVGDGDIITLVPKVEGGR